MIEDLPPLPDEDDDPPPPPDDVETASEIPMPSVNGNGAAPRPRFRIGVKVPDSFFSIAPHIALDPAIMVDKTIAILGVSGSGKSSTARRFIEQHIEKGLEEYPFTVCDIDNEYAMLKSLGAILIAGPLDSGEIKVDVQLTHASEYYALGERAYKEKLSVVLLLGDLDEEMREKGLEAYLRGIMESAIDPDRSHYYRIFIEECQEYVPQVGREVKNPLRKTIIRIAKRGRKRKISLVLISQRPSNVDKDALTQCHILFLHFQTYPTDITIYANSFGVKNAEEIVGKMVPGDVIYIHGKTMIQDHVIPPVTTSPWDRQNRATTPLDTSRFFRVERASEIQAEVAERGKSDDEGMAYISTAYIHRLERDNETYKERIVECLDDLHKADDLNAQLREQITDLESRLSNDPPPPPDESPPSSPDSEREIASLREQLSRAKAATLVVDLLTQLTTERT